MVKQLIMENGHGKYHSDNGELVYDKINLLLHCEKLYHNFVLQLLTCTNVAAHS